MTDKTLPASITQSPDFPDSKLYNDLLEMERKLDWTMMRKKVEIQDAFSSRPPQVRRMFAAACSLQHASAPLNYELC